MVDLLGGKAGESGSGFLEGDEPIMSARGAHRERFPQGCRLHSRRYH
jgi:hypothetical protein